MTDKSSVFQESSSVTSASSSKTSEWPQALSENDFSLQDLTAFATAIQQYVNGDECSEHGIFVPSSTTQEGYSQAITSSTTYVHAGDSSSVDDKTELASEVTYVDGIPLWRREQDLFKTRMRHNYVRTQLARCQLQQAILIQKQSRNWSFNVNDYAKISSDIRALAYKARGAAEWLQSQDLRARCEYWHGRGSAGVGDWDAAVRSFELAIQYDDVASNSDAARRFKHTGLKGEERQDIHFLLTSAERHRDEALKKAKTKKEDASKGKPGEKKPTGDRSKSTFTEHITHWRPDRGRCIALARNVHEEGNDTSDDSSDGEKQAQPGSTDYWRRMLSEEEWKYIHGDVHLPGSE